MQAGQSATPRTGFAQLTATNPSTWLAGAAAATTLISIAASQILLGLALLALLAKRELWRRPPLLAPMLAFFVWTLASLAASPDPAAGWPTVKKFYVFLMLAAVFSAIRTLREVTWVAYGWLVGGSLSVLWAMMQGARMYLASDELFYFVYTNKDRVTGFMGHWMTFSGVTMMALLVAGALLLFRADSRRRKVLLGGAFILLGIGLLIAWQRTQWAGAVVGVTWLLWSRKKVLVLLAPVGLGLLLLVNPFAIRDRVIDLIQPQYGVLDSAAHRRALREVGRNMVIAHPLFGVGPEQVPKRFYDYAPPEIPRPVPGSWSIEHLHNTYYHYAAERGIPALLAILWLFAGIFWQLVPGRKSLGEGRWMVEAAIACALAVLVGGWGEVNLKDSEVLGMFLAVLGCAFVVRAAQRS